MKESHRENKIEVNVDDEERKVELPDQDLEVDLQREFRCEVVK